MPANTANLKQSFPVPLLTTALRSMLTAIWKLYALCFCWKSIITGSKTAIALSNIERLFASFMFTVNCCTLPSNALQVFCNLNYNISGATPVQRFLAAGTATVGTATPVQLHL